MAFSTFCRRAVNGSFSQITSMTSSSQMRSKHTISRAQKVSSERPLRQFVTGKDKSAGRNSKGRITIFHRGGGAKRSQRTIDLKRNTSSVGVVERIEYDPNRTSRIAVVRWVDGAVVDRPKKVNFSITPPPKMLPSITTKGQFSFSSIPGMIEDTKVESSRPKSDHVVVGLPKGHFSSTLTSQSQSQTGTQMTNVKDVFLSAFSYSNMKSRNAPYSFVHSLGVPRIAVAGAKPEFFVPRVKDNSKESESESESLLLSEVKRWNKESDVWGNKMKRKAAVSWGSLRERGVLGLIGVGEVDESKLKSKVREMEKEKKDGKFGEGRVPVSYILATHQMKAGKMVMNCDLNKRSNDEMNHRY